MEISRVDRYRLGQVEIPHWRARPMKQPVKNLILTVKTLFKFSFIFWTEITHFKIINVSFENTFIRINYRLVFSMLH